MRESRASVLEVGTRFAERYEVIRKLGEGGMGIVYVAKDINTGEEMVLKLIHPDLVTGEEAVKRLMAEGLTARQIRHPNIVAVYDVSQWKGQAYFTMEFVRGGTMRSWLVNGISAGREVPLGVAAGLMKKMLAGLAEAHRMGVVHRDLKPENVLLCGDPDAGNFELKILDFGIAKAIGTPTTQRSGGGAIGTPIYMAPEQMTSADAVGPPADLFSLSVMFYEMLMDAPPQARWEPVSKNRRDVPPVIDDFIEKGLSARPRSRYRSAAEYEAALDAALGGVRPGPIVPDEVEPNPPEPPPPPPPPPPEKEPWYRYQGLLGRASKKTKVGVAVITALAIIGYLGDSINGGGEFAEPDLTVPAQEQPVQTEPIRPRLDRPAPVQAQPDQPETDIPDEDVTPAPPPFNASGFWIDGFGNRFEVTHNGTRFTATGNVPGYGTLTLRGTLTLGGARFSVIVAGNDPVDGTGEVYLDNIGKYHMRYSLTSGNTGDFKINHFN